LVDGFDVPQTGFEQRAIVGGDGLSAAIAAASILAKVSRDRFMERAEKRYPGWSLGQHMGYSTRAHRAAIQSLGISPIHRRSFNSQAYRQLTL
jgi:ribonuclease HII